MQLPRNQRLLFACCLLQVSHLVAGNVLSELSKHGTVDPPYVPFFEIWAMGKLNGKLALVTSSHMLYLVNAGTVDTDGMLTLFNSTSIFLDALCNLKPPLVNATLRHGIIIRRRISFVEWQSLLFVTVPFDREMHLRWIINLDTKTAYESNFNLNLTSLYDFDDSVWLSASEPDVFFQVRRHGSTLTPRISLAMYQIIWKDSQPEDKPDLASVQPLTKWYTICMKNPGKHDQSIYMTMEHNCSYPVDWHVISGYSDGRFFILFGHDQVYLFEALVLFKPGLSVGFMHMSFDDFFWGHSSGSSGMTTFMTVIIIFLFACVGALVVVIVAVAIMNYMDMTDSEKKSARTMRDESRLKDVKDRKPMSKKVNSDEVGKITSSLLPAARESQKLSLKTNPSDGQSQGASGQMNCSIIGKLKTRKAKSARGKVKKAKSASRGGKLASRPLSKSRSKKPKPLSEESSTEDSPIWKVASKKRKAGQKRRSKKRKSKKAKRAQQQ